MSAFDVFQCNLCPARIREGRGIWWAKPKAKKSLGTPRVRWEDNIKCVVVVCIDLAEDRDKWWFL